jgi:flagellar hook-associated protein 3 FlgL
MSFVTSGDAARFATFGQDVARLKTDLQRLSAELGSGRKADIGNALGGDFTGLSEIQRGLRLNDTFRTGLSNAAAVAQARQASLDRLAVELENAGPELLAVVSNGRSSELALRLADAPDRLAAAISALNVRVDGQSLFAGDAPDQSALADASAILAQLRPIASGAPDIATAIADIDAWFQDAGGGFETIAYLGGAGTGAPLYLGEGELTQPGISATEPGVRTALSGLAMAALAAEGSLPATAEAQASMAEAAAERMLNGDAAVVEIRARLGVAEGRIEEARVRAEATRTGLQLEEARLTSADPYDSATELEKARLQLENLYVLTSRLSNLTLSAYLR